MTVAILDRQADNSMRYAVPMTVLGGVVDRTPAGTRTVVALHKERVNFTLGWARCEPGFVAQHYREWFGC